MTVSVKRTMSHGMYFQVGYTLAKAIDDGPDALVVGRSGNVQNSYATARSGGRASTISETALSRGSWLNPNFTSIRAALKTLTNNWKLSSVITAGSGRPINATIAGDPNGDGDIYNDRLPGYTRNAFIGPDYFSTDLRLTRSIRCGEHVVWNLIAESFNVFNRTNARLQISDDGYYNSAGEFVDYTTTVEGQAVSGRIPDELTVFDADECVCTATGAILGKAQFLREIGAGPDLGAAG